MKKPILMIKCRNCGRRVQVSPKRKQEGRVITLTRICPYCAAEHVSRFGAQGKVQ